MRLRPDFSLRWNGRPQRGEKLKAGKLKAGMRRPLQATAVASPRATALPAVLEFNFSPRFHAAVQHKNCRSLKSSSTDRSDRTLFLQNGRNSSLRRRERRPLAPRAHQPPRQRAGMFAALEDRLAGNECHLIAVDPLHEAAAAG